MSVIVSASVPAFSFDVWAMRCSDAGLAIKIMRGVGDSLTWNLCFSSFKMFYVFKIYSLHFTKITCRVFVDRYEIHIQTFVDFI